LLVAVVVVVEVRELDMWDVISACLQPTLQVVVAVVVELEL
jgi:hypothetical protein